MARLNPNLNYKVARASDGVRRFDRPDGSLPNEVDPPGSSESWSQNLTHGQTFKITGQNFGLKPNGKTLTVWRGEDGTTPNSMLCRQPITDWGTREVVPLAGTIAGQAVRQNIRGELPNNGLHPTVQFNADRAYVCKRRFDDFTKAGSTRFVSQIQLTSGVMPTVGQVVTGTLTGLAGRVNFVDGDTVQFDGDDPASTIAAMNYTGFWPSFRVSSSDPKEPLVWDGGTGINLTGYSSQRERNDKHIRFWGKGSGGRNGSNAYVKRDGSVTEEYAAGDTPDGKVVNWQSGSNAVPSPEKAWFVDEVVYQTSQFEVPDGIVYPYVNGRGWANPNARGVTWSTYFPVKYFEVATDQFTRGPRGYDLYRYSDYLYVDVDWARVIVSDSPQLYLNDGTNTEDINLIPLPILSWTETEIELVYLGYVPSGRYLHVVSDSDVVVQTFDRGI